MSRFLLDQGLAPWAAALLRANGWQAVHVSEIGLAEAEDLQILEYARQNELICVTLDHDFHTHLALSSAGTPSVILLRAERLRAEGQAALIELVWAASMDAIKQGAAISSDGRSIRIRPLPLR